MPHFPSRPEPVALPYRLQSQTSSSNILLTAAAQESMGSSIARQDAEAQRIRAKNRRKRYLELHPEYFKSLDLELADPLLYDRLVRRFQTPQEREIERHERGFGGVLEAGLMRGEAKHEALNNPDPASEAVFRLREGGLIVEIDDEEISKNEGWDHWVDVMGQRFMMGEDDQFDYGPIDRGEEYDDHAEEDRVALEKYIDEEPPEFVGVGSPRGETGIQDF